MKFRLGFLVCLVATAMAMKVSATSSSVQGLDINAGGAFTCDFGLASSLPINQVPPQIERDRMYMAAQPGFIRKLIPIALDPASGAVFSGGRYLFTTKEASDAYFAWVTNNYILDGVKFFDRPYFLSPDCRSWSVIGAHDFSDLDTDVLVRTERWLVPADNQRQLLTGRWPALRDAAAASGFSSVWLLYNKQDQVVSIVAFANRIAPPDPSVPDFASLFALEDAPPLGQIFDDQPWTPSFDRTEWVLTTWLPFQLGDRGAPSLWPNSPPFPQPYAGDGVCEVSRGETYLTAPTDCLPTCGNGIADPGETTLNCPGDVRLPTPPGDGGSSTEGLHDAIVRSSPRGAR